MSTEGRRGVNWGAWGIIIVAFLLGSWYGGEREYPVKLTARDASVIAQFQAIDACETVLESMDRLHAAGLRCER